MKNTFRFIQRYFGKTAATVQLMLAVIFFSPPVLLAQPAAPGSWAVAAQPRPAFVANSGQYSDPDSSSAEKIYFGTEYSSPFFFTGSGLIAQLVKQSEMTKKEREDFERRAAAAGRDEKEKEGEGEPTVLRYSYVRMEWEGANPDVQIEATEKRNDYWNFINPRDPQHSINQQCGYEKITYRNLYPGIDAEYTFHEKEGLKYTLIVHPGADAALIKMKYTGADRIRKDAGGNLIIAAASGSVCDHAPVTFCGSNRSPVKSSFHLAGNTVSFVIDDYDQTQELIIDPWVVSTTNPAFSPFEVSRDAANNVYVYGSQGQLHYYVQKYNAAGALQWTTDMCTATTGFSGEIIGDIVTDPAGNTYVSTGIGLSLWGAGEAKLNTAGAVSWNNTPSPMMWEVFRLAQSCDHTRLIGAGCGPSCCDVGRTVEINPATGVHSNVTTSQAPGGDMRAVCFAPNGYLYTVSNDQGGGMWNPNCPDRIICYDPANAYSQVFHVTASYGLWDGNTIYNNSQASSPQTPPGLNAIAAGCHYFYVFVGDTLEKRNLTTGALLASVAVPGGSWLNNMGVSVDDCGNVYAGSSTGVYIYDENLSLLGFLATPAHVTDLVHDNNGTLYAVGGYMSGFVAKLSVPQGILHCTDSVVTDATCLGNGSATVNPTFCSPPYTYQWDATTGSQTGQTATNLAPGTYTCIITGSTCGGTDTAIVTVSGSTALPLTLTQTPSDCSGPPSGTATATPAAAGQFTYHWYTNPVQTSSTATGLSPGPVAVTVTDTSGCTVTDTIIITQTGNIPLTTSFTAPSCFGSTNGSATVITNGGTAPFTYSWNTSPVQTTSTAANLGAGTFVVTVTDSVNCTTLDTVVVTQPAQLTVSLTQTASDCSTPSPSGTATAIPGNAGQFVYAWNTNPVQTSATASGLNPGPVSVTITDVSGCTASATITVGQTGTFPTTMNFTAPDCFGGANGSATVNTGGGISPYAFSWNTTPVQTTSTAVNLGAGTFIVTITDSNNCTAADTVVIPQPPPITATISSVSPSCFGDQNGMLTVQASGGTGSLNYLWNTSPVQNSATASGIGAGNYSVTVTDSLGCSSVFNVLLTQPAQLTASATVFPPAICQGSCAALSASASGGTGTPVYNWMPGNLNTGNASVCPASATTYTLLVTDSAGCTFSDSVAVVVNPLPVPAFTADTLSGCAPLCVSFINNSSGSLSAIWDFGDGSIPGSNHVNCYTSPGNYDVKLVVTDANGCTDSLTQTAYVHVYPVPVAAFTISSDLVSLWDPSVCVTNNSSGAQAWVWNFNDPNSSSVSSALNPCHSYSATGAYCIELRVMNEYGCADTTEQCLDVYDEATIYIPNTFTPNGSGFNEIFMPVGEGILSEGYSFMIFDRWGMLIYDGKNWGSGWDGTFKGNRCQQDVYVWKLECVDVLGKTHQLIGHVNLIR